MCNRKTLICTAMMSAALFSCTTIKLTNSDGSFITYKGSKVFTNTSVSLSSGAGCSIPIDPNALPENQKVIVHEPGPCNTQVAQVTGVNVSALGATLMGFALAIVAMLAAS